jgi:hypothetical protein
MIDDFLCGKPLKNSQYKNTDFIKNKKESKQNLIQKSPISLASPWTLITNSINGISPVAPLKMPNRKEAHQKTKRFD